MDKETILRELEKRREKLKKRGVLKIGLFGSYLKGTQKRGSDIDLLVTLQREAEENYFELLFYLEHVLHRRVDLIIERDLLTDLSYVKEEAAYVRI